jgi:hypothetical protein
LGAEIKDEDLFSHQVEERKFWSSEGTESSSVTLPTLVTSNHKIRCL